MITSKSVRAFKAGKTVMLLGCILFATLFGRLPFHAIKQAYAAVPISFHTMGTSEESPYLYNNSGSLINADHRFADNNATFTYKFVLDSTSTEASVVLDIAGQYMVQGSKNGSSWTTLANSSGTPDQSMILLNLNALLASNPSKTVYLKFSDRVTTDGFGPALWHLTLNSSATVAPAYPQIKFNTMGNSEETAYLYNNNGSMLNGDHRFADNSASFTYKFTLNSTATLAYAILDIGNQYVVSGSKDNTNWTVLATSSGTPARNKIGLNASGLLNGNPSKTIYLKLTDREPSNGFGPALWNITLNSGIRGYGVLLADPSHRTTDYGNGIRWAEIEVDWSTFEPTMGTFANSALPLSAIQQYKDNGWKVELSFGIHNAPAWAKSLEPWKDQSNNTYTATANMFNATIQDHVKKVIQKAIAAIGADRIDAVRLGGLAEWGEMMYPFSTGTGKYVAFSSSATSGSPVIPARPVTNWRPGNASPNGEASTFYYWYIDSLVKFADFQASAARNAGFAGDVMWLMPGTGITPNLRNTLIANNLGTTSADSWNVGPVGADWQRQISQIAVKDSRTVIAMTGINDISTLSPDDSNADPGFWSAPHWIAYNADQYGLRKTSESDHSLATYTDMQRAFSVMQQWGYERLMWAHDSTLYSSGNATVSQYGGLISANP